MRFFLVLILIIGLCVRLYRINLPLLEFYPSRQIQTADITRNLYRDGFQILKPQVSYLGSTKQLFPVEFPFYNFFVALTYKIAGTSDEIFGRILSLFAWVVSFFLIYKIAKIFADIKTAMIATFFYTFSPLSVLISRSFQPDQWMLTFSLASLYVLYLGLRKKSNIIIFISALLAACALLIKLPSAIFTLLPAYYLISQNQKRWINLKTVIFSSIAILPALSWYYYASIISKSGEALTSESAISNWFGFEIFFDPKFYSNIYGFENNLVLMPTGILLFLIGIFTKLKKNSYFFYVLLGSVFLYFIIFNKHNMTHEYYHLPFLVIASIFIGHGALTVLNRLKILLIPKSIIVVILGFYIFVSMLLVAIQRGYKPISRYSNVLEASSAVKRLTSPSDIIIGSIDASPAMVYYSDRLGWSFDINRSEQAKLWAFYGIPNKQIISAEDDLEAMRAQGAKIFVAGNLEQFISNKSFVNYMTGNYFILEKTDDYIIFDLKKNNHD